jgi:hypothetical protein
MNMIIKKIFTFLLFFVFVSITNLYSYNLPKDTDLLKLLPDKVGNWTAVSQSSNWTKAIGATNIKLNQQIARNVYKVYKNGDKKIRVSIYAGGSIKNSLLEKNHSNTKPNKLKECEKNTNKTNIQGFNALTTTMQCSDRTGNVVKITFINDEKKDFHYYLRISSFSPNNTTDDGLGNTSKATLVPASIDDLVNFTNTLDLKGISKIVK